MSPQKFTPNWNEERTGFVDRLSTDIHVQCVVERFDESGAGIMPTVASEGKTLISVNVQPGAFSSESLVTFDSTDGPVSGFVPTSNIITKDGKKFIEAEVVKTSSEQATVRLHGSFFTTTGLAEIKTAA